MTCIRNIRTCGDLEETLMAACDFMERAYEQAPVVDVDSIMRDANEKIVFQLINTEQNKTFFGTGASQGVPGSFYCVQGDYQCR